MTKIKFPTLAVIILIFALAWLLTDIGVLDINLPWLPVILIIVALGWIINRYSS